MPSRAARFFRATLALGLCLAATAPVVADELTATVPSQYATAMRRINPRLHDAQSRVYATALLAAAERSNVDPMLVMAVVTVESHWDARAISVHGAEGLGQLKPGTAHDLGVDPMSARSNLRGIAAYLHQMLSLFRDAREPIREAIAGYNAGPYAVKRYGGIPHNGQTPHYVAKVMNAWQSLRARLGSDPSVEAVATTLDATNVTTAIEKSQAAYWGVH